MKIRVFNDPCQPRPQGSLLSCAGKIRRWPKGSRPLRTRLDLCRFEICSHIKYRFFEESVTFVHYSVLEDLLCFWYLSREFDWRMKAVCLQEKFLYFVSVCVPHWYDFSNTSFPKDGCCVTLSQYFAFYFGHEYISKCYGHFRAHRCSMGLKKIFSVKLNDKVPFSGPPLTPNFLQQPEKMARRINIKEPGKTKGKPLRGKKEIWDG